MTSPFVGSPVTGNSQNFDLCLSNIFLGLKVNHPRLKTALSIEIQINGMIFFLIHDIGGWGPKLAASYMYIVC